MLRLQAGSIDLHDAGRRPPRGHRGAAAAARPGRAAARRRRRRRRPEHAVVQPHAGRPAQKTKPYLQRDGVPPGDLVRGRSRGASSNTRVSRRRRAGLRTGHAREPHVVFRRARRSTRTTSARAKALLAGLGLTDRNGDGMLEDAAGTTGAVLDPHAGAAHPRADRRDDAGAAAARPASRSTSSRSIRASLFGRFGKGDYESIYFGFQASALDPAMNLDFWLSGGPTTSGIRAGRAATPWEKHDRRPDAAAGRGADARRAAAAVRRGAEDLRREPAGDLFRRAEGDHRDEPSRRRRGAGAARSQDPVEAADTVLYGASAADLAAAEGRQYR